jgi:SAM-dependent methyltransferase
MLIEFIPTFDYFSNFVKPELTTKILDFGSNCGNYLKSSPIPLDYTGIDVDQGAIEEGQKLFPNSTWLWYNRYNPAYNSTGERVLPKIDDEFDLIISYSVFTHMTIDDTEELLDYLYSILKPGGKLCFSFCDVDNRHCVEWFRSRRTRCDPIKTDDFIYLVNNRVSIVEPTEPCIHFVAFYNRAWLLEKLKRFNPVAYNVPEGWLQDCILIVK